MKYWLLTIVLVLTGCLSYNPGPLQEEHNVFSKLDPHNGVQDIIMVLGTDEPISDDMDDFDYVPLYFSAMSKWALEFKDNIDGDFIVFMSHGHSFLGIWYCEYNFNQYLPVDNVISLIRKEAGQINSEVPIVLLVCNKWGHSVTSDENVYYSTYNIFMIPDSAVSPDVLKARNDPLNQRETVAGTFDKFIYSSDLR